MRTKTASLLLVGLLCAGVASAAVWRVDSDAPGGGDGTSWATAFQTIQAGIDADKSATQKVMRQLRRMPSTIRVRILF
ncbi:MAG: hypothetical protein ACLFTT_06490 [Candidatus Hydrogenedentota bacterium]